MNLYARGSEAHAQWATGSENTFPMNTKGKTGTSSRSASTGLLDETHANGLDSGEENVGNAGSIVVSNPAIPSGEAVFRGTRVPFKSLTNYLQHERSLSEFLVDFPSVSRADAIAALEEARICLAATLK